MDKPTIEDITDTLEILSLKRIFKGLSAEQQEILVQDLMEMAGIDSVCRLHSVVTIEVVDMTAPDNETPEAKELRLYRNRFELFIMPFLTSFLRIIHKSYMDECFEIYQILANKSIGGRWHSQVDTGDKFVWALTCHQRNWDHENFLNEDQKRTTFEIEILDPSKVDLNFFRITADFPDFPFTYRISIDFTNLLVLLKNSPERAYMVLFMLGYLEGHPLYEKTKSAFGALFPAITDFTKLRPIFTVAAEHYNYTCPDFPGLRTWTEDINNDFNGA